MNPLPALSVDDYAGCYGAIAQFLGSTRRRPPDGEVEFLRRVLSRPDYPPGWVGTADALFLTAVVSALEPTQVVEIGTASGASAALIAAAIARARATYAGPLGQTIVHTIDIKHHCRFDKSKQVGYLIRHLVPELEARVQIHAGADASLVGSLVGPGQLKVAFIDGNHHHPWPLIDVLHVLPMMRDHGWIVLHDINIPELSPPEAALQGPRHVFAAWPGPKLAGINIGAVQVPLDRRSFDGWARKLIEVPFEVGPADSERCLRRLAGLCQALG